MKKTIFLTDWDGFISHHPKKKTKKAFAFQSVDQVDTSIDTGEHKNSNGDGYACGFRDNVSQLRQLSSIGERNRADFFHLRR